MNLQSIVLIVLLVGAFLLAMKKGKNRSCSGSCPDCPHQKECGKEANNHS